MLGTQEGLCSLVWVIWQW